MRRPRTLSHARARTALRTPLTTVPLVALGLLLAACGGGVEADAGGAAPAPDTTSTETTAAPTTTSTAALSPEDEVAASYRQMWVAIVDSNSPPDPSSALLTQTMAGEQLAHAVAETSRNLELGVALRLPANSISTVGEIDVVVEGSIASLASCVVDDAVLYETRTGHVLNDRIVSGRTEAEALLTASGWRITQNRYVEKVEGSTGCR
jgi:hypothetical protein